VGGLIFYHFLHISSKSVLLSFVCLAWGGGLGGWQRAVERGVALSASFKTFPLHLQLAS
jgi:hypothetical protein